MISGAIRAVVEREFKRFIGQRGRLLSTFVRPLLWLIVIGSGYSAIVSESEGISYHQYLLPGIFGMVLLFSTMLSALATVHDREFGPIRMLLIAPVPRATIVWAKTLAATLLGSAQALLFIPLLFFLGVRPGPTALVLFIGSVVLTALALASFGMLLASRIRSIEGFAVLMNFVIFPMFFLSGALYPAARLPAWLQPVVRINPLTYGIDLMKHTLLPHGLGPLGGEFTPTLDVGVLLGFTAVALLLAQALFGREEHLGRILLAGTPKRAKRSK